MVSVRGVWPHLLPLLAAGTDPAARTFARPPARQPAPPRQAERPPETSAGALLRAGSLSIRAASPQVLVRGGRERGRAEETEQLPPKGIKHPSLVLLVFFVSLIKRQSLSFEQYSLSFPLMSG